MLEIKKEAQRRVGKYVDEFPFSQRKEIFFLRIQNHFIPRLSAQIILILALSQLMICRVIHFSGGGISALDDWVP